jgi:prevent-host-death family protein
MKTASIRELRNNNTTVLGWVADGEEVRITNRGKTVARLVPDHDEEEIPRWKESALCNRDRSGEGYMSEGDLQKLWDHLDG